jgi:KDO2-lipid IV(A) lauroyltransferase
VERPDRTLRQRATDPLIALALASLSGVANRLGPGPGYAVASAIGTLWYRLFRTRRRIIDRNLDIAFRGQLDPATRTHIGRACCQHALANVIEGFIRDRLIRSDNWQEFCTIDPVLADALSNAGPRGLAVLSAHLGSWEMGLYACGLFGKPLSPVVRSLDNPFLDRRSSQLRGRFGERIIRKSGALLGIMRELRGGGRVAIVADQSAPAAEGYQPFFGVETSTYSQYARVLVRQGCRVVFAVCVRDDFRFRFHTRSCELHVPETGSIDARADALVRSYLAALEDAIRAHVEQYLWMHRRYKVRPHGALSLYARLGSALGAWANVPVGSDAGPGPVVFPSRTVDVVSERPRP